MDPRVQWFGEEVGIWALGFSGLFYQQRLPLPFASRLFPSPTRIHCTFSQPPLQ